MQVTLTLFSFPQILKCTTWSIAPISSYLHNLQRLRSHGCCCCRLLLLSRRQRRSSINPPAPLKMLLWSWSARSQLFLALNLPIQFMTIPAPPLTLFCIPCVPTQSGSRPGTLGAFGAEAGPAQQRRQCRAWSWQWEGRAAQTQCAERSFDGRCVLWPHVAAERNRLLLAAESSFLLHWHAAVLHKGLNWWHQLQAQHILFTSLHYLDILELHKC